jgi:hypothetical protein
MLEDGTILQSEACLIASRVAPSSEATKAAEGIIKDRIAGLNAASASVAAR